MECEKPDCCSRNFLTKEEKLEKLNNYKKWLEQEKKGVEEAIKALQAK